jgi:phosphoenolpyruvate---glycerone phosphotransferase subunit DhaK
MVMQKIMNEPRAFVDEMLEGVLLAHPQSLRAVAPRVLVRADAPRAGKVAIVTGGGSGHLPLFMGYVGTGLADGVAVGDVFASPSSEQILEATRGVSGGAGVVYLYGNYSGDVMNFDLAAELAELEGIETATFIAADDVASAPAGSEGRRRGVAGIAFLYKVAGAIAEAGGSLAEVVAALGKAAGGLRSMGVALSPCTLPAAGAPTFELPVGEMEIGMGIHGEPGVRRGALEPAAEIARQLAERILADLPYGSGDQVAVLVNGLGATPAEELYVLYRSIHAALGAAGVTVRRAWVGEYATSLEMAGASVSLMKVDEEILGLLDAPCASPFLVRR